MHSPYIFVEGKSFDMKDRWTGEVIRTVTPPGEWIPNPEFKTWVRECEIRMRDEAMAKAAMARVEERQKMAASRSAVLLSKFGEHKKFSSPMGSIRLDVRPHCVDIYVNLVKGGSGSTSVDLTRETLPKDLGNSYLTGLSRQVVNEFWAELRQMLA